MQPFPPASPYKPQPYDVNAGYWTSGLFDCMNDPTNGDSIYLFIYSLICSKSDEVKYLIDICIKLYVCISALITALFPFVTFGQVAEIVDRGHTSK